MMKSIGWMDLHSWIMKSSHVRQFSPWDDYFRKRFFSKFSHDEWATFFRSKSNDKFIGSFTDKKNFVPSMMGKSIAKPSHSITWCSTWWKNWSEKKLATHKRIYFYFASPTSWFTSVSNIHNVSALSLIETEIPVWVFALYIDIDQYWMARKWWKKGYFSFCMNTMWNSHSLASFGLPNHDDNEVYKASNWFPSKMIKKNFSSHRHQGEKARIGNYSGKWRGKLTISFVHDENKLNSLCLLFRLQLSSLYFFILYSKCNFHFQVIKVQWKISHANWIAI
jgi:hypothetical protein